jgi:DMSO reductase family type II enzyme chaperone
MSDQTSTTTPYKEALARSALYELLSLAFLYPQEGAAAQLLDGARKESEIASRLGWDETKAALDRLSNSLSSSDDDALEAQYVEVFGHAVSADCAPYESEYGQAHVFQKSQTLADLSTFYRAFGVSVNPKLKDRLDHVSVEMEFMHLLTLKEAYALYHHGEDKVLLCRQAQEAFLANHLANWIKAFIKRLTKKTANSSVYASVALLLGIYMDGEFDRFGLESRPLSLSATPDASEDYQECDADAALASAAAEDLFGSKQPV